MILPVSNMMSQNVLSPAEIAGKKFEKSRMGGYRPADVDAFLDEAAASVSALGREITELKKKLEAANKRIIELQNDEISLSQALLNAQRLADGILKDSREKADLTLRDAEIKADKILEKAESATLAQKDELLKAKRETSAFKHVILEMYKHQVEAILKIPDDAEKPKAEEDAAVQKNVVFKHEPPDAPVKDSAAEKPENTETADKKAEKPAAVPQNPAEKPGRELNIRFKEAAAASAENKSPENAQESPQKPQEAAQKPEEKKPEKPKFRLNLKYDENSGEYIPASQDDDP